MGKRKRKAVQKKRTRKFEESNMQQALLELPPCCAATGPSRDWMIAYRERHSDKLWHGNVSGLTVVRAKVTQAALSHWTDRFEALLAEKFPSRAGSAAASHTDSHATALRIWNADETGFSSIVTSTRKTWAVKGAHNPALNLVSARLTDHLTVCVSISAAGQAMPPFCISTGLRVGKEWLADAPTGSSMHVSTNGSMTQALFPSFLRHFVANLPPRYSTSRPTILLMDNHNSRESSEALEYARANRVTIFGLLSNSTHFLQPCDRFALAGYKAAFNKACYRWLNENHGAHSIPKRAYGSLLRSAQGALTTEVIVASWKSAGLFPIDRVKLDAHPDVLQPIPEASVASVGSGVVPPPVGPFAPVRATVASLALQSVHPAAALSVGCNGQLLSSGQEFTSRLYITAVKSREAARAEKQAKKQGTDDMRTLKRADELRAQRAAAAEEDSGDEGKENEPPVPAAAARTPAPRRTAAPAIAAPATPLAKSDPPSLSLHWTHRDTGALSRR